MRKALVLLFALFVLVPGLASSEDVSKEYLSTLRLEGAGASFPYPIYSKWANAYQEKTGMRLNYASIGSGGGIRQIKARSVNFGASDKPLKAEELEEAGLMQFPMIIGGVVPVFNIPGVKAGEIKLDGEALADIFLGEITKWNDDRIMALNPGKPLPEMDITVVHRSDGSGTTWIFTNYLTKVSNKWADKIGNHKSLEWPVGVGGKGNEGIANNVKQTEGGIGYVEYAYALQNNLSYVSLKNKAGKFTMPTAEAFQAAAASADWASAPGYYVVLTDQPGDNTWPIVGASFILLYKKQDDWKLTRAMLQFFDWCYKQGPKMAAELDYVPIPLSVVEMVENEWANSVRAQGKPVWEASASEFSIPDDVKKALGELTLEGAGASFPFPIYSRWSSDFQKAYGMRLNYQSIGSGGGIRSIKQKTVDFGASDAPLTKEELDEQGLMQFPMIVGGVVPVFNLPGIKPGDIKLSSTMLADIFLGKITKWNDEAIAELNPTIPLPDKDITVVHRADASGTTWIFTNYLTKVSSEWKDKVGNHKSCKWPVGLGGKGNEGIANTVRQTIGGIGYVEYAYALQNDLSYVALKNREDNFVMPNEESFSSAAANADWKNAPGYYLVLTDQPGDNSWPIVGASFILIYKEQTDMMKARCMLNFFNWCYRNGAEAASQLDYIAIPQNVADIVEADWAEIIKCDGKPCWSN